MSSELAVTWLSAVVALTALFFTGLAARAAVQQTALQRRIHEDAQSPAIWVDVRPDPQQGHMFLLLVGNSGATVARDVTVVFDPPFEGEEGERYWSEPQALLASGLSSLPPGREMSWNFGVSFRLLERTDRPHQDVVINGTGPFGPLPELRYPIRIDDYRHGRATPGGTLNGVAKSIDELAKAVAKGDEKLGEIAEGLRREE